MNHIGSTSSALLHNVNHGSLLLPRLLIVEGARGSLVDFVTLANNIRGPRALLLNRTISSKAFAGSKMARPFQYGRNQTIKNCVLLG